MIFRLREFFLLCGALVSLSGILNAEEQVVIRREPLIIRDGGTADEPRVFDGHGMIIDLGTEITDLDWMVEGDVWTAPDVVLKRKPIMAGQTAGLFVNQIPIALPRDLSAEKLHPDKKSFCYLPPEQLQPGQMTYDKAGRIVFRWPAGVDPKQARIVLPGSAGSSGVTIACSHVIVRNITARYAGNDGFNIHGSWIGIRLEDIRAECNADEGISAHDDVEMSVRNAEVSWNGSTAGGVADVGNCSTRYESCQSHDNYAAGFFFTGKQHVLEDCLIYHQQRGVVIQGRAQVEQIRTEWKQDSSPSQ